MGRTRLLDYDPLTGEKETFHYEDGVITIRQEVEVNHILEANKARFASVDERERWGRGRRVASIPNLVLFQLRQQGILDDRKAFKRWLNDPDNKYFRTSPGRV